MRLFRKKFIPRWLIAALLFAGFLAVLREYLSLPRRHHASATLEIRPPGEYVYSPGNYLPLTEAEVASIFSPEILSRTLRDLNLIAAWSIPANPMAAVKARARLLGSVTLEQHPVKGLIELGAWDEDPQRAADIANTIAGLYQNYREQLESLRREKECEAHKARARDTNAKATVALDRLNLLRENEQIHDPDLNDPASPLQFSEHSVQTEATDPGKAALARYRMAKSRYLEAAKRAERADHIYRINSVDYVMRWLPVKIWERAQPHGAKRRQSFSALWQRWKQAFLSAFRPSADGL